MQQPCPCSRLKPELFTRSKNKLSLIGFGSKKAVFLFVLYLFIFIFLLVLTPQKKDKDLNCILFSIFNVVILCCTALWTLTET